MLQSKKGHHKPHLRGLKGSYVFLASADAATLQDVYNSIKYCFGNYKHSNVGFKWFLVSRLYQV